jgi:hypothetical protein
MKIMIVLLLAVISGVASAQISLKDAFRSKIELNGDGSDMLVNCPWEKKLSISLFNRGSPAVIVKCVDGGPGVETILNGSAN